MDLSHGSKILKLPHKNEKKSNVTCNNRKLSDTKFDKVQQLVILEQICYHFETFVPNKQRKWRKNILSGNTGGIKLIE